MNENITLVGTVHIDLIDETGKIKDSRDLKNLVVTGGKTWIASRMVGVTDSIASHIAIGTGTTPPIVANTTLEAEIARLALSTAVTSSVNVVSHSINVPAGTGTGALTEAGIFNASTGGTMISRLTFDVVNKLAADTLAISWNLTIV